MNSEIASREAFTCNTCLPFTIAAIAGTFSAISCKVIYNTESISIEGKSKAFVKPVMLSFIMFIGMMPSLLLWKYLPNCYSTSSASNRDSISRQQAFLLILPSACDLISTLLLLVAQIHISTSLWQMLRGSTLIITALLKRFVIGHVLRYHMWLGIIIISFAISLTASIPLGEDTTDRIINPALGVLLVVLACAFQGLQCELL
jgi:hypothetical protein